MSGFGVVIFPTTSSAFKGEALLKGEGRAVKLIPSPRRFTSDCGYALRFPWADREHVEVSLERSGVSISGIHPLEG